MDFSRSFEELPEFLSTRDLVKLGLYPTIDAAYMARIRKNSPNFIKLKHKVLYPKNSIVDFIEEHMRYGSICLAQSQHSKQ